MPNLKVWGDFNFKVLIADPENDDHTTYPTYYMESLFASDDSLISPFVDDIIIFYKTIAGDLKTNKY